jgi:3-deoxy-manno-octulosonate cytidylyltransferase (CMP-KDO synthetase)
VTTLRYTVLIPARLASTRLPNKPLASLAGIPMVVRVAQRVRAGVSPTTRIVVAGDSASIIDACQQYGIEAVLTRKNHVSGSDRLAEASELLNLRDEEIVVNVQGDEPLIDPSLVEAVAARLLHEPLASMGTAVHTINDIADFINPNVVKVVLDRNNLALYFSRAPISWWRDRFVDGIHELPNPLPLRHIGIYSYRVGFLKTFPHLPPAPMEALESLEQLRALWHGHRIAVHVSEHPPSQGVDTPEDLEKVRRIFLET